MPKKSESLRLLELLELSEVRQFAAHYNLPKSGSAADVRRCVLQRRGTNLDAIVSLQGPWTREDWNAFLVKHGATPQPTIGGLRAEVRRLLLEGSRDTPTPPPSAVKKQSALPEVGSLIKGRYTLLERLGAGGFGTVFAARDEVVGEDGLVLKFANEPAMAESVLNEYRKAGRLHHVNICAYKHYDHTDEFGPFVVMRHGGTSLAKRIAQASLSLDTALHVLREAAAALDYAHENEIIHGDVNPGNVLMANDGLVRLTDFGIAAFITRASATDGHETRVATKVHGVHPLFGAPEVHYGVLKPASDQFSLALVFTASLTGLTRFAGPNPSLEGLSRAQQRVLDKALSSAYAHRFRSCTEFAEAMLHHPSNGF